MKNKALFIIIVTLVILTVAAFYVKAKYFNKPQISDVAAFMKNFDREVSNKNTDSLLTYFDLTGQTNYALQLLNVLTGVTKINGEKIHSKTNPIIKLKLLVDESEITTQNDGLFKVVVPIQLKIDGTPDEITSLTFIVHNTDKRQYKIAKVENQAFVKDYMAYENKYKQSHIPEKDIYSAITLQAFKTADQLKSKYDSVVWFSHINKQTYFYVIKGEWEEWLPDTDSAKTYKMGLVNPQMKEIIPIDYDLVYGINATFKGLVEVEKDHKRGFYNLNGEIIVPVEYEQIFPVVNSEHLAALKKGDNYYWLEKDYQIGDVATIGIKELLTMLPSISSFNLTNLGNADVMELNSHENHSSMLISPSYLIDLNLLPNIKYFRNALRKNVDFYDASSLYKVAENRTAAVADTGRFEALVYSIRDYFIGGRSEFYDSKNLILVDKQKNRVYSQSFTVDYGPEGGEEPANCTGFAFKPVSDSLFELKVASTTYVMLYDKSYVTEMPMYHYMYVENNKLKEKTTVRMFGFSKFVKMDDSYTNGCYFYNDKVISELTPAILKYMKNEIYADYGYVFKDKRWTSIFEENGAYTPKNISVEDSLTAIDRYNIDWINQRLKTQTTTKLAAR